MTHINLKWLYSCLDILQTNCQVVLRFIFKTSWMPQTLYQKCQWLLYSNQKQESDLWSDCENIWSYLMEFVGPKFKNVKNWSVFLKPIKKLSYHISL